MIKLPQLKDYDVIVVGAGPSGCSTAIFLARAGKTVLLVDKAKFPREKVCGDAISGGKSLSVIRDIGALESIEKDAHGIVYNVRLVAPNGYEVSLPFEPAPGISSAGYVYRRKETDDLIFKQAQKEDNITIIEKFRVTKLLKDNNGKIKGIDGTTEAPSIAITNGNKKNDEEVENNQFFARVVVGADGVGSIVSRQLGFGANPPEHMYVGVRGYWDNVKELKNEIELFFIDEVLPGYLWIFPMGDGSANVGLGILASDMKKSKKHPNKILLDAIKNSEKLKGRFADSKLQGNIGAWTIPLGSYKKKNSGDGWVLVGDAASLVDPFSGEGFGNAATSGKYAAETIDKALNSVENDETLSAQALKPYSDKIEQILRPEMDTTYRVQRATRFRFLLNLLIKKAATKPEFKKMMTDMLASNEEKKQVQNPLFYLKLLLP